MECVELADGKMALEVLMYIQTPFNCALGKL